MLSQDDSELIEILKECRTWLKIGFYGQAKETLASVLNDDRKRTAYLLADGVRSIDEIRKAAFMGPNTLIALFRTCEQLGLMEQLPDKRRKHIFDLDNFNLMPNTASNIDGETLKKGTGS